MAFARQRLLPVVVVTLQISSFIYGAYGEGVRVRHKVPLPMVHSITKFGIMNTKNSFLIKASDCARDA